MEERVESSQRLITYEDIVVNIVRRLNITDFSVIDRMTISEYTLLMEGARLRSIDELENIHLLAYKMQVAKNTKKVGDKVVPAFENFTDFFDRKLIETGVSSKAMDVSEEEKDIYKLMSKA